MRRRRHLLLALLLLLGLTVSFPASPAGAKARTMPFADARLKIELNATDGDAGLQVFLDGEPWRAVSLYNPAGRKLVEITAKGPLKNYGLTELFSESSEPSFDVFPFEQFKQLFPEGVYTFRGKTIDGKQLLSTARLTHDVPDGPRILRPRDDAEVPGDHVVVAWKPVQTPGVDIVGYQVVVTREDPSECSASTSQPAPGGCPCRRSFSRVASSTRPRCWPSRPAATRPSPKSPSR
jgi:hypothetical protein